MIDRYERVAREIVGRGGGILLPFDAGDAPVAFASRWELAKQIADALRAEGNCYANLDTT